MLLFILISLICGIVLGYYMRTITIRTVRRAVAIVKKAKPDEDIEIGSVAVLSAQELVDRKSGKYDIDKAIGEEFRKTLDERTFQNQ